MNVPIKYDLIPFDNQQLLNNLFSLHFYKRNRLKQLGGNNAKKAIRLIMKYLFTDTCLDQFTWRGTGDLGAFKQFVFLNQLIYSIVCSQFEKHTLEQYQSYMVQWIKHSTTRQRNVVYHYPNRNQQQHENDDDSDEE